MIAEQLIYGSILISLTVIVHAIILDRLVIFIECISPQIFKIFGWCWKIPLMVLTVLVVFLAHMVEMGIWAWFYMLVDTFDDIESALYFSASSFTTVGFGDVYLGKEWRLISSIEGANGFILFGWSTAFIFEIISKLYKDEKIHKYK